MGVLTGACTLLLQYTPPYINNVITQITMSMPYRYISKFCVYELTGKRFTFSKNLFKCLYKGYVLCRSSCPNRCFLKASLNTITMEY